MGPHSPVCVLVGLLWKAVGAERDLKGLSGRRSPAFGSPWAPTGIPWGALASSRLLGGEGLERRGLHEGPMKAIWAQEKIRGAPQWELQPRIGDMHQPYFCTKAAAASDGRPLKFQRNLRHNFC